MTPLSCPQCASSLQIRAGRIMCPICARPFERPGGVVDLATRDFYWNQIPREAMAELISDARALSWRAALERHLRPRAGDYVFRYATDERRADFACLLPGRDRGSILDLGCGWGAVTTGLARVFREVASADSTRETLEFTALRLAQEGLAGVTLARIDPLGTGRLPFPDGRFDAVVLNGVLEWVGQSDSSQPVEDLQKRTLCEARRCLRPGGALYLGIENRFGIEALRGAPDHNGLSYTSLLPRPLARVVSRLSRAGDYRTYTHSLGGYRRLLLGAGFERARLFLPKPSYRQPDYILAASREALRFYFGQVSALGGARRWAARLVASSGLYPYVADSFAWVAEAPA